MGSSHHIGPRHTRSIPEPMHDAGCNAMCDGGHVMKAQYCGGVLCPKGHALILVDVVWSVRLFEHEHILIRYIYKYTVYNIISLSIYLSIYIYHTLYNIIQHNTTKYNIIQHNTTMYIYIYDSWWSIERRVNGQMH